MDGVMMDEEWICAETTSTLIWRIYADHRGSLFGEVVSSKDSISQRTQESQSV